MLRVSTAGTAGPPIPSASCLVVTSVRVTVIVAAADEDEAPAGA